MISAAGAAGVGYYAGGGGSSDARDASGRNYYTGAVEKGERPGTWSGSLAEEFGLVGQVDPEAMAAVYEGFVTPDGDMIGRAPRSYQSPAARLAAALAKEPDALPERVEEIRLAVEADGQSTCRGVDLTAAPPKSVSVAYVAAWRAAEEARADGTDGSAVGPDGSTVGSVGHPVGSVGYEATRAALDAAILSANQSALDAVADVATTRLGKHGNGYAGRWMDAPNLAVASFPQLTSREGDPHFHVHNVVLNRGATEDGTIGALDTRDLGQQRHFYSAVFDRSLAEELGGMGVQVEWTPTEREDGWRNWEIVGIDQGALDSFSQRRAQITKAMAPIVAAQEEKLGRELNALESRRLAQTMNLVTRQSKDETDIDWSEKLGHWTEQLTDDIGMGLRPIADQLEDMMARNAGGVARAPEFSPEAVIAQARYELAQRSTTWNAATAYLAVDQALPAQLGVPAAEARAITEALRDQLLVSEGVTQIGGTAGRAAPASMAGTFVRPSDATYAAPETLEAENLILRAAVERGRGPTAGMGPQALEAWREQVNAQLDAHYSTIQPGQRAAVVGLASSDAALAQLIGPAGTGKSFCGGALAGVWTDMTGGRVIGLATSQKATEVLREDGVPLAFNLSAWQAMQGRLASGNLRGDEIRLGPLDLVLIDETSMVTTPVLNAVRSQVEAVGARAVAMGDPAQLGAVGAGGAMSLLEGAAETYTLTDVRRFSEEWEREASLGLRSGSREALQEYDRHGRLIEVDTMEDAFVGAARAAAAGIIGGQRVAVEADQNADAYRIGDLVRDHLVAAGRVEEQGLVLARSDQVAGIGDSIMTRQIDRGLGVLNGTKFDVIGTGEDGSLSVVGEDGAVRELPADYVAQHVHLGYASTVHSVQGATVDLNYGVPRASTSAASLYVMSTRGADGNWLFVAVQPDAPAGGRLSVETEQGGQVRVEDPQARPSAVSVLGGVLERETESRAALMEQRADVERNASVDTLIGRVELLTHMACRARLDGDLDRLVEDGVLSEGDRARLGADQSTDHLSRVCRAAEQAGLDPAVILRDAVEERELDTAKSAAQVIADRITSEHDVAAAPPGAASVPGRISEDVQTYLEDLHEAIQDRGRDLGAAAVQEAPAWAVKALGPVPDDAMARLEWETKAGAVAAYREAKGLEDSERVSYPAPGLSQTEARALWDAADEAMGRPTETRLERSLTDGALQARVAAWEREQAWAPAHANASLRQASLDAEHARQEAILARATGDDVAAERWEQEAHDREAVAGAMEVVSEARGEWAAEVAVTQDLAERAAAELRERGLEPRHERDRVTAEEWLEHQREVDARDEAVRDVTELDVPLVEDSTVVDAPDVEAQDEATDVSGETSTDGSAPHSAEESGHVEDGSDRAAPWADESGTAEADGTPDGEPENDLDADDPHEAVSEHDGGSSGGDLPARSPEVSGWLDQSEAPASTGAPESSPDDPRDISADSARHATDSSEHAAEPEPEPVAEESSPDEQVPEVVADAEPPAVEKVPEPEPEPERETRPAHVEAPLEPDDHELDALVATARDAQEKIADRESETAARDAWEAEQTAAPEAEGSSGTDAVDEASYPADADTVDA